MTRLPGGHIDCDVPKIFMVRAFDQGGMRCHDEPAFMPARKTAQFAVFLMVHERLPLRFNCPSDEPKGYTADPGPLPQGATGVTHRELAGDPAIQHQRLPAAECAHDRSHLWCGEAQRNPAE